MRNVATCGGRARLVALGAVLAGGVLAAQGPTTVRPTLSADALAREFTLDGNGSWSVRQGLLALVTAGKPGGAIRRPSALALVNGPEMTATTLAVEVRSTAALPDVTPRRDALLVVGYQSPTRFYYVHLSAARDDVHNGIFLVNDADRKRIDTLSQVTPLTDQQWHAARVVRTPSTGRIEVFVDDMTTPIMLATDATLAWGRAGVGSFDDTAEFRNVVVTGTRKMP
ncbi:hypothetical protein [Luteitalea sp. TBR-22]|uniref:hypothetical protein n=1 Tax=Luteitalea sp. TBR-22 TaxID=2802971 RepID=UPI001EF3EEF4|nr:hypothetical protein [Luteitalea sp. TBR-22]